MATWKLEDAKNQFSRLVQRARRYGPQFVTRRGREAVVVMSVEEYRRLASDGRSLVSFMRESPLTEAFASGELEILRSRDFARDVPL